MPLLLWSERMKLSNLNSTLACWREAKSALTITWQASSTLLAHVNIGRDFRRNEADTFHGGVAVEWAPLRNWSVVAERVKEGGGSFQRAGVRWTLTPAASIDLSRAQAVGADSRAWWTLGLTWVWN